MTEIDLVQAGLPQELAERFRQISELPHDWNSYGAQPFSPQVIRRAGAVLLEMLALAGSDFPKPFIAPGSDGLIVFEWKTAAGIELILDIPEEDGPLPFYLVEPDASEGRIEEVVGETWPLSKLVNRLQEK